MDTRPPAGNLADSDEGPWRPELRARFEAYRRAYETHGPNSFQTLECHRRLLEALDQEAAGGPPPQGPEGSGR